jgi:hypothetical protein
MRQHIESCLENFPENFKSPMEKIYHIYAKDRCLFHSVKEEDFQTTWNTLNNMVGIMKTDYTTDDLSYEELLVNKEAILNSSH